MNPPLLLTHFNRVSDAPEAIPRLRRFILDLAVRGKLVVQDPKDEPASELLKRIQSEKSQLVKDGKIRLEKPPTPATSDDLAFDLKPKWIAARISQILVELQTGPFGSSLHQSDYQKGGIPVVNPASIKNERLVPVEAMAVGPATLERLSTFKLRVGDIVMARRGEMGRCAVVTEQEDGWLCGTGSLILRLPECVFPRFFVILIGSPFVREYLGGSAVGATMQNLNQSILLNLVVGLPPLAEQHRIVVKVDELMAVCDRLEATRAETEIQRDRLTAASLHHLNKGTNGGVLRLHASFCLGHFSGLTKRPDQVKQLRQTILNLAVRGKLVSQDPSDEPASELLKRIQTVAERLGEKNNSKKKPLSPLDSVQEPFTLPSGWSWARFPELGFFGRGKSKHRPRNDQSLFEGGTHLLVQTGDVARSNGLITTFTSKYNDAGLAQSFKWPQGTLCITIAANIADSGILSFDACFPDSVVGFIPSEVFPNARYFEYFIRTAKADLLAFAPATAQKNINLEILSAVLIPLPPLAEQQRIVARVNELMALCNRLEGQLAKAQDDTSRLLESLLHYALITPEPIGNVAYPTRQGEAHA